MNALIDAAKDTSGSSVWIALVGPALVALIGAAAHVWSTKEQGRKADEREEKIRDDAKKAAEAEVERVDREREADRQHQLDLAEQQHRKDLHLAWRAERVAAYRDFRSVTTEMQKVLRDNHAAIDNEDVEGVKVFDRALRERLTDARSEVFLVGGQQVVAACDKAAVAVVREQVLRVKPRARILRSDGTLDPLEQNPMAKVDAALKHFTELARKELGVTDLQAEDLSEKAED